jgi:hypothetical protein
MQDPGTIPRAPRHGWKPEGVFLGRIAAEELCETIYVHARSIRATVEAADKQHLARGHGVELVRHSDEFRLLGEFAFRVSIPSASACE